MARLPRIEYPGALYHVITRGNNRQTIFKDDDDRIFHLKKLAFYCKEKRAHLLCYCLLLNHVHLLLETPEGNLSKLMQPFQTSYTAYFNRRHSQTGHVFEQRYKAFLVDRENYLLQVSRYIHLNPVGAGLVKRPESYRWSSYRAYLEEKASGELYRGLILGQFGGGLKRKVSGYREFVEEGVKGKAEWSRVPVLKQAFVGDEDFVEEAWRKAGRSGVKEVRYGLRAILEAVCGTMGIESEELVSAARDEKVERGRELFMYVARRYSDAGLREIVSRLGARDISTVSHGVRRAEARLEVEWGFHRLLKSVLRKLSDSSIQA
jgi:REP element-mobilizing transposase RayT